MITTDLHYREEISHKRQGMQFETCNRRLHDESFMWKGSIKHQLHLRRNCDQGQTVAMTEGTIADGRQRGRQKHFAQHRIVIEGVLETKRINKVNRKKMQI